MKLVKLLALFLVLVLTGCNEAKTHDVSSSYILPEGLSDCKVFYMIGKGSADNIAVVRCPNSNTSSQYSRTYTDGDNNSHTVTYRSAIVEENK